MTERVIVIGGGVIGLALAWRLLEKRAAVTVIDDAAGVPPATAAAAGMLAPSFEEGQGPVAEPLYRFSAASLARWRDFAARLERDSETEIDFRPFGILAVGFSAYDDDVLRRGVRALTRRGGNLDWLSLTGLRVLEPALSGRIATAVFAPDDGQVDPRRATAALRRAVRRAGGEIIDNERAVHIHSAGGRVRSVMTVSGARHEADHVVVAAGAASHAIAMEAPLPMVFPVKGEAVALGAGASPVRRVVRAPGAYLCPKADGRLIIGATETPHDASLDPSPDAIAGLVAAGARALPPVARMPEIERWAGSRPGTPDGAPLLGEHPEGPARLWFALGHYRNGVLLAPETADILASAMLDGAKPAALADFRPDRFNH